VILRGKRERDEIGGALPSIRLGTVPLIGAPVIPLELGRFFLSSVGLHLLLFWAMMTVRFYSAPPPERPLQVRLLEAEIPKPLPMKPLPLDARSTHQAAPRDSPQTGSLDQLAPRDLSTPSVARAVPMPPQVAEVIRQTDSDERRRTASRHSAEEFVNDLGLPAGNARLSRPSIGGGAGAPDDVRPKAVGGGVVMALPSSRSYSGPAVLGGTGGGDGGGGPGSRGGARRLGAELTATLAPTVTVGPRQGATGRGGASPVGKSAGPDYGANPPPKYPPLAREKGYEGTVYLRVQVQGDGRVGTLAVDRSSGYEILDRAAADSVKEWTFLPAQKDGRPLASWVLLPVKFMLK